MLPGTAAGKVLPEPCQGHLTEGAPLPLEDLRSVLPGPLRGTSWSDSPATKPKPRWQGWFSTQVWQLVSEQCMPARHWHTVLCVALPCVFTMRPVSGQREQG